MDKSLKKFEIEGITYIIGFSFDMFTGDIQPQINIFKGTNLILIGCLQDRTDFCIIYGEKDGTDQLSTFKDMLEMIDYFLYDIASLTDTGLPENVKQEFENIFILCKFNDFKDWTYNG